MQRIICLMLCVTLAQPAWSQSVLQHLMPSPLTILLTIGQWMKKDRVEVFYVQVRHMDATKLTHVSRLSAWQ